MLSVIRMTVLVVVSVIFFVGCSRPARNKIADLGNDNVAQRKAALLNKIRNKYENPDAHYELGKMYYTDGLWSKAEFEFNVALGFSPIHKPAQAAMIKTLIAMGNEPRAKLAAENYINQASVSAQASATLAKAFQKEGLDDYAMDCYRQALGLAPNSAILHRQIGYYYLSKGDKTLAEEYLRRSFQLDPYQPEVAGELGRLGIAIQIPRKTSKSAKKVDKIIDEGSKKK